MSLPTSTLVVNFVPDSAPNPSCCSDRTVMCRNCAEAALRSAGSLSHNFDEDTLPIPNVMELLVNERRAELARQQMDRAADLAAPNDAADYEGDDILPLPVMNWAEEARRNSSR